jgi:hypothetical protein
MMNVIPSLRGVPLGAVVSSRATPAESLPADPGVNLVIEELEEFGVGTPPSFLCWSRADYVIDTPSVTDYN